MIGTDITFHTSGVDNVGGAIGAQLATGLDNLFHDVVIQRTEYRCIFVKNSHGSDTALNVKIWIESNTPSGDTNVEIALGEGAINDQYEPDIYYETVAPVLTDTFTTAPNEAGAKLIGALLPGYSKAIWIKRTVTANGSAANDPFTIKVKADQ